MITPRSKPHQLAKLGLVLAIVGAAGARIAAATVAIDVSAGVVVRTVDDRMFGLNTAVWDNAFNNAETLPLLRAIDLRMLRFPGGSTSDTYDWQTNKSYVAGTRTLNTWSWSTSFDDFARTALAAGAQAFITVNYGSGTAQQAADWVTYSNVTNHYGFKYWEIGNECYGSWEEDIHASKQDPLTYADEVKEYLSRMKAADPSIKVGIVVIDGEEAYAKSSFTAVINPRTGVSHQGWTPILLARLKAIGVTPDFAIFHRYPYGPGNESDAGLLSGRSQSGTTWAQDAAGLRQQLNDYLGPVEGPKVELVVTENNSVFSNTGKQTTSLVNALFMADSVGSLMQTEFNSLVWWGLRNGPQDKTNNNSASLYGWRNYGDYGVVAPGNATETPVSAPYPTYYMMKLLSHFARGGDQVVRATSDNALLATYAVKRTNGTLTLLVINKDRTATTPATISVHGYTAGGRASVYSYGIAQDEASRTGVGFPDVALGSLGGVGQSFETSFAPYSATVITLYPLTGARSRIVNLSVRALAGADSETLIVGYVVGGANTTGKLPLLVRALGPSLTGLGVTGALADPRLAMHTWVAQGGQNVDTIVATNDNWGGTAELAAAAVRLGAFPLDPASLDAAFYMELESRAYTSHVNATAGTGVAIAEVYDGSSSATAATPRLINISGRAEVSTGDNVLIAGFVVVGEGPKTVLIRGLGPALSALGVEGSLATPKLELHARVAGSDQVLAGNLAWGGSPELVDVFHQVGATPTLETTPDSKDTVLLVTLLPGVYTAVISGANATTGVALVEVYEVE